MTQRGRRRAIGPTEARLGLIGVNTLLALGIVPAATIAGLGVSVLDAAGLGLAAVMPAAVATRAARNLRELARREPVAQTAP